MINNVALVYIHGFGSSKHSSTSKLFNELGYDVYAADYDSSKSFEYNYSDLKTQIRHIVDEYEETILIGASLGGFYAKILGSDLGLKTIRFNPVVDPYIELRCFLGRNTNFYSKKTFEFSEKVLESYKNVKYINTIHPDMIFVSDKDELLKDNVRKVKETFMNAEIITTHTPHRISNIKPFIKDIKRFINTFIIWENYIE